MGKSAVAAMFTDLGVPVFDADAAVHELQGAGGVLLPAIEAAFPGSTDAQGVKRNVAGSPQFRHLWRQQIMCKMRNALYKILGPRAEGQLNSLYIAKKICDNRKWAAFYLFKQKSFAIFRNHSAVDFCQFLIWINFNVNFDNVIFLSQRIDKSPDVFHDS